MNVKNFIDLHVHIGPEIFPRKFTVSRIIKEQKGKIRGMALKNHFFPTMPLIISGGGSEELMLIGSVTLNSYLGGLNPDAIYASAKLSKMPIIVWFPTINAENFLRKSNYKIPQEWVGRGFVSRPLNKGIAIQIIKENDELTEETIGVLKAIKQNDCILATGHVSWKEAKILVEKANKMGIKRIIITHPIYQLIDMPIAVQKELGKYEGVYIEQSYAMHSIDKIPIEKIAEQIKYVGARKFIISSDMGQLTRPSPNEALEKFTELLKGQGITEDELIIMGEKNPRKLLK